jgi:predicted HTH domain antitoxin
MGLSLNVQIPESLQQALELAGYSAESLEVEARRALAASLYARRILTLAQAAQLAQMPMREFLPFLASMGLPALNYPPSELNHDVESIRWQIQEE